VDEQISILCDSAFDKSEIMRRITSPRIVRVINVDDLVADLREESIYIDTPNCSGSYDYLRQIEPERFKNGENPSELVSKLRTVFSDILDRYGITTVHFGCQQVFRSIGFVILQDLVYEKKLRSYMVFDTPLKTRRWVCDDIYGNNRKFVDHFSTTVIRGLTSEEREELNKFYVAYSSFLGGVLNAWFTSHREKSRAKPSLRHYIKHIVWPRFKTGKAKQPITPLNTTENQPNILLLLPKAGHWATSYMNPDLNDQEMVARTVLENIPDGYNLVIKIHPKIFWDFELEALSRSSSRCFFKPAEKTADLVNEASIIVFYGTTSGVEALMQKKHVIELGKKSMFFDFPNSPVMRAPNPSQLGSILKKCTLDPAPEDRIDAYFFSLLETSNQFTSNLDEIDIENYIADDHFQGMAHLFAQAYKVDAPIRGDILPRAENR
jgi:hypothetical protein